jgi:tRNA threonylcarbamoyladenosine biosynthesis protein TsaE
MESQNDKPHIKLLLSSEDNTKLLASQLARSKTIGRVFLLYGDIGAGKTFFARAFIQEILSRYGLPEDIPSPTYTLVQTYETPELDIWHVDLYRLVSNQDIIELGITDAFNSDICLVEWPEKLNENIPPDAVHIELNYHSEFKRECTLTCNDQEVLNTLRTVIEKLPNEN